MLEFRNPNSIPDLYSVFKTVQPISQFYPGFNSWYWDKVVPGIQLANDKIIIAEKNGELVGVAILKDSEEKKLRALRITEKFQKSGAGLFLIDQCLKELKSDKPIATVPEEMFHQYSRIFVEKYGFELNRVHKGMYRPGKLEYSFNEVVDLKKKTGY